MATNCEIQLPTSMLGDTSCHFRNSGYLIGVLMIKESYNLGVYIRGRLIFVSPHVASDEVRTKQSPRQIMSRNSKALNALKHSTGMTCF